MQVDDVVDGLIVVLHRDPVAEGADQVAHGGASGGLHPREDSLVLGHFRFLKKKGRR